MLLGIPLRYVSYTDEDMSYRDQSCNTDYIAGIGALFIEGYWRDSLLLYSINLSIMLFIDCYCLTVQEKSGSRYSSF
jgi:hypothetical protein